MTKEERVEKLEKAMTMLDGVESILRDLDDQVPFRYYSDHMEDFYMQIRYAHDLGIWRIRHDIQCAEDSLRAD